MQDVFNRMPERCDPYMYFQRVRPWIHGWRDNPALPHGLVYEGETPYTVTVPEQLAAPEPTVGVEEAPDERNLLEQVWDWMTGRDLYPDE